MKLVEEFYDTTIWSQTTGGFRVHYMSTGATETFVKA